MTTDLRALCAKLVEKLDEFDRLLHGAQYVEHPLTHRARAALAEPEPETMTESEIESILQAYAVVEPQTGVSQILHSRHFSNVARAILSRYSRKP